MGKIVYTERDIEDMAKSGLRELNVNNDVVLTDLAFEATIKLGIKISIFSNEILAGNCPKKQVIDRSFKIGNLEHVTLCQITELKEKIKQTARNTVGNSIKEEQLDSAIEKVLKFTPFRND